MADEFEDDSTSRKRYSAVELRRRANPNRRPTFDSRGNLRGYRSVPGANKSPRDVAQAPYRLPPADPNTGFTDDDAWNQFFQPTAPTPRALAPDTTAFQTGGGLLPELAPQPVANADNMSSFLSRPYTSPKPNPGALYQSAVQSHAAYLGTTLPTGAAFTQNSHDIREQFPRRTIAGPYGTASVRPASAVKNDKFIRQYNKLMPDDLYAG